ncbi:MAG TPA: SseB family protein, partial [Candidatus Limnocylindria bacterium]|nr:SseB family protein [Candidatus Limnocylindria bacterium]
MSEARPSGWSEPPGPADRPAPGSHDRSVPTGSLETSAAAIYEAAEAARAAQDRADGDAGAILHFYRTLASATLLLPLGPGTGEGARRALEQAVSDAEEVEIAVMLARDSNGGSVNVLFSSPASLAAWAPVGSSSLPLPGRIVLGNLAASGLPAVLDPAG